MGNAKKQSLETKRPRGRPAKHIRFVYIEKNMDFVKKIGELNLNSGNLAENWQVFHRNFKVFSTAIEISKKNQMKFKLPSS